VSFYSYSINNTNFRILLRTLVLNSHHFGISIVWAAQAGAKRVYAIEYTAMANHARRVVQANGVDHIVTVIQGAVEDVILPEEDWDGMGVGLAHEEGDVDCSDDGRKNQRVVDIILSGENQACLVLFGLCDCVIL